MSRTIRGFGALALCLLATGCARVAARGAPPPREIAVVPGASAPRVSVAHEDSTADLLAHWVPALLYPPLARHALRGTARLVGDVRLVQALQAGVGTDLHGRLADAVLAAAPEPEMKLVLGAPADEKGCAAAAPPTSSEETLHVAVVSVSFLGEPDALLGLAVGVRGVLRGPRSRCAERTLILASGNERPLDAWSADGHRELQAELHDQIASAGPRLVAALLEPARAPGPR